MGFAYVLFFYLVEGPAIVIGVLKLWSAIPLAMSALLLYLATKDSLKSFWLTFFGTVFATAAIFMWVTSGREYAEMEGPEMFGFAFFVGGIFGWFVDLLIASFIVGFMARQQKLHASGEKI